DPVELRSRDRRPPALGLPSEGERAEVAAGELAGARRAGNRYGIERAKSSRQGVDRGDRIAPGPVLARIAELEPGDPVRVVADRPKLPVVARGVHHVRDMRRVAVHLDAPEE